LIHNSVFSFEESMNNGAVAHIRKPNEDELKHLRQLWASLKQQSVPAPTEIGVELQTYLKHAVRMVGLITAVHDITGEPVKAKSFPVRVTEDGVARIHDAVGLWSAILALWISTAEGVHNG
jgi:hypothetical protein